MTEQRKTSIENEAEFNTTLLYVAEKVGELSLRITGERLPVTILKLFAHSDGEYKLLEKLVRQHGPKSKASSANSFYVNVDSGLAVAGTNISLLGVRRPDINRPELGCGDYEVENFSTFATELQRKQPQFAKPVENQHGLAMLELSHPEFDVLGYVIPKE